MQLVARMARYLLATVLLSAGAAPAADLTSAVPVFIKVEVEDFGGFERYKAGTGGWEPRMAWYPQWSRGGDSGWWAAQVGSNTASGEVTLDLEAPQAGAYRLWVRYEDYLGKVEPFDLVIRQAGGDARQSFGSSDVVKTAQPPFAWSYAWDVRDVTLKKGPFTLAAAVTAAAPVRRGLDAVVLTTDAAWVPKDRGFPPMAYARFLDQWTSEGKPATPLVPASRALARPPAAWTLPVTAGRDFWVLGGSTLAGDCPYPVTITPEENRTAFLAAYKGKWSEAPVFSSPVMGVKLGPDLKPLLNPESPVRRYILQKKVPFVLTGNYASFGRITNSYADMKAAFGELWLGIVSGENSYLGMPLVPSPLPTGPGFKESIYQWLAKEGREAWRAKLSADWASPIDNPFERFILCVSVESRRENHRLAEAGCTVLGAESASAMSCLQHQMAFSRGAARQYGIRWMWYWGASFGDAIRTFVKESPYTLALEGLTVENRNDVIGPSLAHMRRTMLLSYLEGVSFFFPEQGYNMIDPQGGLTPMGWCYDELVRLAARHPDRGIPCTPVAVLIDRAHGWEKYTYEGERVWGGPPLQRADRMLSAFFNVAYYPFPRNEGDPVDDLNVPFPNGRFGDIFDVLVTSPTRRDAIRSYPVVFCVGDTRLDADWARTLKEYVQAGGTLVINAEQVVAGLDEAFLGAALGETREAAVVVVPGNGQELAGTLFPYRLAKPTTARVIAATKAGDPVALVNSVGQGQVILTTPLYLLGHDLQPHPYFARLLADVTAGLLPVTVRGNVEYAVNLHPKGYVVTLSHNEGIAKPSHGPARFDASRTSRVELALAEKPLKTEDWLGEEPRPWAFPNEWLPEYTQPVTLDWKQQGDRWQAEVTLRPGEMRVFCIRTR